MNKQVRLINNSKLAIVWDKTGHFYCRQAQIERVLNTTRNTQCVSVCTNGELENKYIYNPDLLDYWYEKNGTAISPEGVKIKIWN